MKRLFKDKRGMTLTEMLVALTLLMIVVVGTTPVMLSSYDGLYQAGEKAQSSYEAKSEIEDTLATRNSVDIVENFKVNFDGLGQVFSVNGKRAVSSLENSFETIFMGGRAYVAIVSSKIINDDKLAHDVVLQTTNITFASKDDISYNSPSRVTQNGTGESIDVSLYLPDKNKTALSDIYGTIALGDGKGIEVTEANPETGRIYIKVRGVDFTNSPAKIEITYLDETDRTAAGLPKIKKTSCYLTIKTPTIMAVGTTTYGDYYTSAGVEIFKNPNGTTYNKLFVDARRMDIGGTTAGYTKPIPSGTVFKSVNWITEYETASNGGGNNDDVNMANTVYEPAYYVLTGTNGAIYRTYSFNGYNTAVVGKVNPSYPGNDANGYTAKHHALAAQEGKDVVGIADSIYTLDDSKSTIVYPAVWGGDFSHIFGFSAYGEEPGYTNRTSPTRSSLAWYTEDVNNNGKGQAGYYSNFANMAYYYNGWALSTPYYSMNSKKISYVLTEIPYAVRIGGYMGDVGSASNYGYDGATFDRIWERPYQANGSPYPDYSTYSKQSTNAWFYGVSMAQCAIVRCNEGANNFKNNCNTALPVYYVNNATSGGKDRRKDNGFAQIRLKALTTLSPTIIQERGDYKDSSSDMRVAYNTTTNQSKVIVTDAVYLPQLGGVFYVGTVAAYGWITQVDNYEANNVTGMNNTSTSNTAWPTFFWVKSNDEGTNTTVLKTTIHSDSGDITWDTYRNLLINNTTTISESSAIKANSASSHSFYVLQPAQGSTTSRLFSDVYFTMGFASNREILYTNIVYGRDSSTGQLSQSLKFCEPYYFKSHYDDENKLPSFYMNGNTDTSGKTGAYLNSSENDYYNVWFPGEMYNLTKVATKDGVTVSVGYAVAGSSYTYLDGADDASTGLGAIYNDGVLAAMVLNEDTAFTNLLYFKDNEKFDGSSLSNGDVVSGKNYKSWKSWDYGTHARDSVQFTCVDISVESILSGSDEVSTYYAYYADNKGRLYKSKVATKTTSKSATTSSKPVLVSHISDKSYSTNSAPAYMEEIKIGGQSLGAYFSKITTVSCDGDYIIVGGHSKDSNFNLVIGKITYQQDSAGNPISSSVSWKYGVIGGAGVYQLEDAIILDGYIYLAGVSKLNPNLTRGFVCALPLEQTGAITNGGNLPYDPNLFVGDENLQDPLYSIAGHK